MRDGIRTMVDAPDAVAGEVDQDNVSGSLI